MSDQEAPRRLAAAHCVAFVAAGLVTEELRLAYPEDVEQGERIDEPRMLLQSLDMAFSSLRRCLMGVRVKGQTEILRVCERPAAYRQRIDATHSVYLCRPCYELFPDIEGHAELKPVPYADLLREYEMMMYGDVKPWTVWAAKVARALLEVLPRCPDRHSTHICPRCDYQEHPVPLLELEAVLRRHYWHA